MDRDLRLGLAKASPLDRLNASRGLLPCKLCQGHTRVFDLVDANKATIAADCYAFGLSGVGVVFLRCDGCGFVFSTDFDDWTAEDFARHIYNDDYIQVDPEDLSRRPTQIAGTVARLLGDRKDLRILDYGSGAGVFVEAMRAAGHANTHGYDPYSSPQRPEGVFDLITCFEVVEHSVRPAETFSDIAGFLRPGGIALVQTGLQPADIGTIRGSWWYIAPRNGHLSIFSLPAMSAAARGAGLALHVGPNQQTLLSDRRAAADPGLLSALGGGQTHQYQHIRLLAPGADGAAGAGCVPPGLGSWHALESARDGTHFRWSREAELTWTTDITGPVRLDIVAEVRMAVTPQMLAAITLEVDGAALPVRNTPGLLAATTTVATAGPPVRIRLTTPPPVTPASLGRNNDPRPLGIALAAP